MNVLSLFDGMSCGQQALERVGIKVDNYFASEIDKYAITVTMANYPNTKQLGSVVNVDGYSLPKIDLLIGGSPCQSFSFAGKRKGMSTKDEQEILTLEHYLQLKSEGYEFEGQSYLFWEYMRLLKEVKPKYFLLENVMMGDKWEKVLSKAIGVKPIEINSSLVSAQNRRRLYWTNIGMKESGLFGDLESIIKQPKDKGILLKDILENKVDEKYFLSQKIIKGFLNKPYAWSKCFIPKNINEKSDCLTSGQFQVSNNYLKIDKEGNIKNSQNKSSCITAGGNSGGNHSDMDLIVHNTMPRSSTTGKGGTGPLSRNDGKTYCLDTVEIIAMRGRPNEDGINKQQLETRKDGKTNSLTSVQKDNLLKQSDINAIMLGRSESWGNPEKKDGKSYTLCKEQQDGIKYNSRIRRLTPIEFERLQTVKDNYTNYVSNSQRYKMLGNGWTIDVIAHIFKYMIEYYNPHNYYI
jgi:DNA (cytosine-5)-methyltransferase 3A